MKAIEPMWAARELGFPECASVAEALAGCADLFAEAGPLEAEAALEGESPDVAKAARAYFVALIALGGVLVGAHVTRRALRPSEPPDPPDPPPATKPSMLDAPIAGARPGFGDHRRGTLRGPPFGPTGES